MFCTSVCAEACDSKLAMAILLSEKVSCGRPRAMYSWAFHIAVPLRPCSSSSVDFRLSLNSATCSFSMRLEACVDALQSSQQWIGSRSGSATLAHLFQEFDAECDDGAVAGSQRGDLGRQLDCTSDLRCPPDPLPRDRARPSSPLRTESGRRCSRRTDRPSRRRSVSAALDPAAQRR